MQDTKEETVTETVTDIPAIEPGTLCDRDQVALAYVRVKLSEGYLDFCGHCYEELIDLGLSEYEILDNRYQLSNRMRYIDMWANTPAGRK
jgi:hypothetical protein